MRRRNRDPGIGKEAEVAHNYAHEEYPGGTDGNTLEIELCQAESSRNDYGKEQY